VRTPGGDGGGGCGAVSASEFDELSELDDIGITNGPAEDGTRGLLKAYRSKNMKFEIPISC
jgi:hypothetical protein